MDFPPTGRAEMLMIHHMSFETLISIERVSWRNCPPRRVQRIGSMITLASVSVKQGFNVSRYSLATAAERAATDRLARPPLDFPMANETARNRRGPAPRFKRLPGATVDVDR